MDTWQERSVPDEPPSASLTEVGPKRGWRKGSHGHSAEVVVRRGGRGGRNGRPVGAARRAGEGGDGLRDGPHAGRGPPAAFRPRGGPAYSKTCPGPRCPLRLRHGSGGGIRSVAPGTRGC